jgi:hypothetical protein
MKPPQDGTRVARLSISHPRLRRRLRRYPDWSPLSTDLPHPELPRASTGNVDTATCAYTIPTFSMVGSVWALTRHHTSPRPNQLRGGVSELPGHLQTRGSELYTGRGGVGLGDAGY